MDGRPRQHFIAPPPPVFVYARGVSRLTGPGSLLSTDVFLSNNDEGAMGSNPAGRRRQD